MDAIFGDLSSSVKLFVVGAAAVHPTSDYDNCSSM